MDKINKYLSISSRGERIDWLRDLVKQGLGLPLDLVEDLLLVDLSNQEKSLLVESAQADDPQDLEEFLLRGVSQWPQDTAVVAIRQWCLKTDQVHYRQWPQILSNPALSQRVFYTIIDRCFQTGGAEVLKTALRAEGLKEMSPAVQGLILLRASQWLISDSESMAILKSLAYQAVTEHGGFFTSEHRATIPAVGFLLQHDPTFLAEIARSPHCPESYRALLGALLEHHDAFLHTQQLTKKSGSTRTPTSLAPAASVPWPVLWQRRGLSVADVTAATETQVEKVFHERAKSTKPDELHWELFAGIPSSTLESALRNLHQPKVLASALQFVGGLIDEGAFSSVAKHLKKTGVFADPALSQLVKGRFREQNSNIPKAQSKVLGNLDAKRRRFFDLAYRGQVHLGELKGTLATPIVESDGASAEPLWELLYTQWKEPSEPALFALASEARKWGGIYTLCYVNTLGRCRGLDQAALKVLDFIRSTHEDEMRAVIGALAGIDTPRSLQELIAAVTRPNMTRNLQLEALLLLKEHDLSKVQPHLRSAFVDLGEPSDAAGLEVRELLATMLETPSKQVDSDQGGWDQTFDQQLGGMIQGYRELSSEVKRALRTSLFFHRQVDQKGAAGLIDLSPVVDMQYKALELLFRESFEDFCGRLINRGVLQRKLDIIGYARPIPSAMDQFENYICALPVIKDIPFFSTFKLRKMLRAICQFRPGRRFTLDGLKAFGLFFVCFGRQECKYGLTDLLDLGFAKDAELFEFCHLLHTFQDMRNRAAHEGLHPEASSDMDKLWLKTADVIQRHNALDSHLRKTGAGKSFRTSDGPQNSGAAQPKIIRKVS